MSLEKRLLVAFFQYPVIAEFIEALFAIPLFQIGSCIADNIRCSKVDLNINLTSTLRSLLNGGTFINFPYFSQPPRAY